MKLSFSIYFFEKPSFIFSSCWWSNERQLGGFGSTPSWGHTQRSVNEGPQLGANFDMPVKHFD